MSTQVGEPQNLLIAEQARWVFGELFIRVAPVSMPVMLAGFLTCWLLDRTRLFGYGAQLPDFVREVLAEYSDTLARKATLQSIGRC